MRRGLPDPERFQDWVTDEVLSQIRQTGSFVAPPALLLMTEQVLMTQQAAPEQPCHGACAEQAHDGARPGAGVHRDLLADHRRRRNRRRSLSLVLPRCGRPRGQEQHELGHGVDLQQRRHTCPA